MKPTFFSLFTGGGLCDTGAKAAGCQIIGGVEYAPDIAEVATQNGCPNIQVCRVEDADPMKLECRPDVLWTSTVCVRASQANTNGGESEEDRDSARAVAHWIKTLQSPIFCMENVGGYARFDSYGIIRNALDECGYWSQASVLNAADFGVPQTRKRLILRAWKNGFLPPLPQAEKWNGWYGAIEDLIETLPESQFAQWQLDRLPAEFTCTTLVEQTQTGRDATSFGIRMDNEPSRTVGDVGRVGNLPRAFLVGEDSKCGSVKDTEPSFTIVSSPRSLANRAWLETGRVVKMTPRALARFQSIPDSYILPDKAALACRVIGNAVPPLLAQKLLEPMLRML